MDSLFTRLKSPQCSYLPCSGYVWFGLFLGRKKGRWPYLLNFNLISWFNNHSVGEENSSWIQIKWLRLLDKVLKYTSHLCWLISPKSGFYIVYFGCRHGFRQLNLINHVFAAIGCFRGVLSIWGVPMKWEWIPLLCREGPFSAHPSPPLPVKSFWGFLSFLNSFYLFSFSFFFFLSTTTYSWGKEKSVLDFPKNINISTNWYSNVWW